MSSNIGEKTRAVFLAALMVVSVFGGTMALAGSAAAQQDDPITLLDENGTEAGKYSDLDTALDNAEQDYTIELTAGDYTLTDDVTISGLTIEGPNAGVAGDSDARDGEANVTFQANIDAENVTVDGVLYEEGSNRIQIYGANTTLKNTVVEVPDGTAPVRLHADNITIANNEFDGLGGNWIINSRQDETNLLDGIEVTDNVFQNAGDGVVQANGWTNALITGNNFSDLDADAVRLAYNVTGTEVTNNIIRNTGQNPDNLLTTGIFLNSVEGEVEISGNEFENNPYHIVVFGNSDEPVIENNEFDKRVDVTDADFADNHIAGQIQAAVDDAAEDATVEVGPGTYNESVTIDTKNVTLTSTAGPEQTKITDPDNHKETVEVTASNVTVDGFTVTSGETVDSNYGSYGIRVIPRSGDINGVTVKNNILKNISDVYRATGVSVSAGVTGNQLQDITVENNTVYDIETTVTTRPKAGNSIAKGITLNGDVKSSEVINNNITDIGGEESAGAHGITLDGGGPTNFTVANNRINSLEINQSVSEEDPYFDDKSAIIVGGFADLGDNHSVYSNNLLDGQVYRYDAGEATDTLDATSNWWGATNGPSGDFDGNGSAVTGPVSIDPATVSLDDGSVNLTQDFLGVVKDSQNVTLSDTSDATFSFDSESVPGDVDGTLVIGINGTDYVFEDALNEGEVDTAVGGGAADSGKTGASIADTTPTGDTAITVVGNNSQTCARSTEHRRRVHADVAATACRSVHY